MLLPMGTITQGARGFTLIETMVVVTIFGIVAAIAAPKVSALARERSAALAVSAFAAELRAARDDARAQGRCMRITNPTPTSLLRERSNVLADGTCDTTPLDSTTTQLNRAAINLSSPIVLQFGRSGALVGAGGSYVDVNVGAVSDTGTRSRTVRVFRELGLVRELR